MNRASDSPIWEWVSAWQVSLPRPCIPSPRVSLPYRVSFHLHSPARASHPSWRLQTLAESPTGEGRARWVPPVCPCLSKPRTVCQGIFIQTTPPDALIPVGRKSASRGYTNSCLGSFFFFILFCYLVLSGKSLQPLKEHLILRFWPWCDVWEWRKERKHIVPGTWITVFTDPQKKMITHIKPCVYNTHIL